MARRVIIQSNAASPFRVSVPGVDAATAEFNNLIFDGNQQPLRLWGAGYVTMACLNFSAAPTEVLTDSAQVITVPSGTRPIFLVNTRQPDLGISGAGATSNKNQPAYKTFNGYGIGGAVFELSAGFNVFSGINFNRDSINGTVYGSSLGVANYAIMKNYQ